MSDVEGADVFFPTPLVSLCSSVVTHLWIAPPSFGYNTLRPGTPFAPYLLVLFLNSFELPNPNLLLSTANSLFHEHLRQHIVDINEDSSRYHPIYIFDLELRSSAYLFNRQ